MPCSCVRGAHGRFRGVGAGPGFVSSPLSPSHPAFPALCVAGRPVRVSLVLARWYAIPRGLCVLRARSGCPSGIPRVSFACACARALAASAPLPPPPVGVACAPVQFRCWSLVGLFIVVCVPPRVLPRSRALSGLLGRGGGPSRSPLAWLGVVCPPLGGPLWRAAGAHHPLTLGAGGAGVWTRHQPHSAHSCELALRAAGAARWRLGGALLAWVWGVRGRALSHSRPPVLWGVRPGPTTHWLWVRGVRAWGPITNPTARDLASWLGAPSGRHEGARGGRLLPGSGASGVGRSPIPDRPSFGACGRAHHPLAAGAGGAGVGTRHQPHSARSCERSLRAAERHEGAQGGRLLPGCGASGGGRSPIPDRPSFGACGQGPLPTGCGCGGCGRGDPSPTPQRALLPAGLARCGGGTRAPGGRAPCLGVGRPGAGALPPPTASPLGRAAGAHYPLAVGARGADVGARHQPHSARSCELAWRAVGAARGRPGGAPLAWVWGVRGRALSHPQPPVPWGVRPGPTTHWLCVRGVRAWGPVTNPTARALASWLCGLRRRHEGALGGRPCLGVERPGSGALPPLTARPLGRAAGAHHPLAVDAGVAGVGARHQPYSARSCGLAWRAVGAAGGRPGGAPLAWVSGVRGRALSHPRPPVLCGMQQGPTTHCLWLRGVRAWGPVTNPTARALASWLGALWGRHRGARGGRLLPGCGASGGGRSPTPDPPSFAACGKGPLPTGSGCGGSGRGDPSPTAQRALLRAGLARCGGGTGAPGGGASCLRVGRPGAGALPPATARPLGPVAGAHHTLAVGAGGAGVGTRHQPHSARSCELALRAAGAAPGGEGEAPLALVWGVRGAGALPCPTARPLGRAAGAHYPLAVDAGFAGVGTHHQPHSARSCELAWRAAGAARGRPGGRLLPACGASGGGRSPTPNRPSFGACGKGPLPTGCECRGCGRGDPPPTLPARALASWLGTLWGRHEGARGGRLLPGCGASGVWRFPITDRPSFGACGRGPQPTGCGCRGCGRGDPSPTPQRAFLRAGFARCGGGTRAPGGRASCLGSGATGGGGSPTPDRPSFGACGRGPPPTGCGCGGCGRGNPSPTPQRALLGAVFARCGGGTRAPGRGASCLGVGRPGSSALQPLTARPLGRATGPTTHWLWVRGLRAWGPFTDPRTRALASWLGVLWGRHDGAWGGRLLPGCGASGVGRSPDSYRSSFGACSRSTLPAGCGCGWCGCGGPSETPQRALLRAGLARC